MVQIGRTKVISYIHGPYEVTFIYRIQQTNEANVIIQHDFLKFRDPHLFLQ
jgi:hypothetical protein